MSYDEQEPVQTLALSRGRRGFEGLSRPLTPPQPARIPRNDGCACGSGRKFKHCCLPKPVAKALPSTNARRRIIDRFDEFTEVAIVRAFLAEIEGTPTVSSGTVGKCRRRALARIAEIEATAPPLIITGPRPNPEASLILP